MKHKTKNSITGRDMEKWALEGIGAIMEADSLDSAVKSTAARVFNTIGDISRTERPDQKYDIYNYINCMRDNAYRWLSMQGKRGKNQRFINIRDQTLLFWDALEALMQIYWQDLRGDALVTAIRNSSLYDITSGNEGVPREIEALGNIISYLHDWIVSWRDTGEGCMFER